MDGKHPMRLQNVNVYVWTGPYCCHQHLNSEGLLLVSNGAMAAFKNFMVHA